VGDTGDPYRALISKWGAAAYVPIGAQAITPGVGLSGHNLDQPAKESRSRVRFRDLVRNAVSDLCQMT
jgi:hypothetical protein